MDIDGPPSSPRLLGRYALYGEIASGGMATVHYGRLVGVGGFMRTVAIKRLHGQFARDPEFVELFLEEARLAARVQHPNVVSTLDVVALDGELFLIMDYVAGETLARLLRTSVAERRALPPNIATSILTGVLDGVQAAHDARADDGTLLGLVHRDISPQNILVGSDGTARVLDFGIAKAAHRSQKTSGVQLKGKLAYMSPEQTAGDVDKRTDLFAAGIVLWECLAGRRLFQSTEPAEVLNRVLSAPIVAPSTLVPHLPPALDRVVLRALERDPDRRFQSARDFALALREACEPAPAFVVSEWLENSARATLEGRARALEQIEREHSVTAQLESAADVTATQATPTPAPRRRGKYLAALAALALLTAGAGTYWAYASQDELADTAEPPPTAATATATEPVSPPAPPAKAPATKEEAPDDDAIDLDALSPPQSPTHPAVTPPPEVSAPVPSTVRRRPSKPKRPQNKKDARPEVKPASGSSKKSDPCDSPTYVDKRGIKRFKTECL